MSLIRLRNTLYSTGIPILFLLFVTGLIIRSSPSTYYDNFGGVSQFFKPSERQNLSEQTLLSQPRGSDRHAFIGLEDKTLPHLRHHAVFHPKGVVLPGFCEACGPDDLWCQRYGCV
jgi:hypothetical protein